MFEGLMGHTPGSIVSKVNPAWQVTWQTFKYAVRDERCAANRLIYAE
jgi:hypothetical protein